ncbi:MAG: hypothetical protein E7Z85_07540 [Methanosphaera stadtmanae]|nr:hypothetical protein [Methanosphaera stadtmanae]
MIKMKKIKKVMLFTALLMLIIGVVSANDSTDFSTSTTEDTQTALQDTTQVSQIDTIQKNNDNIDEIETNRKQEEATTKNIQKNTNKIYTKTETEIQNWSTLKNRINELSDASRDTTITLNPGTYTVDEFILWENKKMRLTIDGNGQTINGNQKHIFKFSTETKVILKNIIITNASNVLGGAISNGGNLTIINTILTNNNADRGGAIYNDKSGTIYIKDSTLQYNTANSHGGAIYNSGTIYINDYTSFEYNIAPTAGAIYNYRGNISIKDSTLQYNNATQGGAIFNSRGNISIKNSILQYNNATEDGGVISCSEKSIVDISGSTFKKNNANNGAAIYSKGNVNITMSNFIENRADNKETIDLINPQENVIKDNVYESTDINLSEVNLYVKNDQSSFTTLDNIILSYTINLVHPDNYGNNELPNKLNDITLYINDVKNVTVKYEDYTLSNLKSGSYVVYYTSCGHKSNDVMFTVTAVDSGITTSEDSYEYFEGKESKIPLIITDTTGNKGMINVTVKDQDEYILLFSEGDVEDGYDLSVVSIVESLKNIYNKLDSSYIINVTYFNDYINPSSTEFTLDIKQLNTGITFDSITAKYNSNVTFSGRLFDEDNMGLSNCNITLTIGDVEFNVITVNDGLFNYTMLIRSLGEQSVTARFAGTDKYNASQTSQTFTVNKKESKITINNIASVTCNDNVTITGMISSIDGTLLRKVNLYIYLNGEQQHVLTDTNAKFKATFTTNTIGEQEVKVIYKGNTKYLGTNATATFTTTATKLVMFTVRPATYRDNYTIQGKVTDYEGNILVGEEVQLTINGETITLITDKNGRYTYKARAMLIGNFTVTATYNDKTTDTQLTVTKTLSITQHATKLIVDEILNIPVGSPATITGKLTDDIGTAYKNCNIYVKVNGEEQHIFTDSKGIFTCTYTPTKAGIQNVTVTYKGNTNYLGDKVTKSFEATN